MPGGWSAPFDQGSRWHVGSQGEGWMHDPRDSRISVCPFSSRVVPARCGDCRYADRELGPSVQCAVSPGTGLVSLSAILAWANALLMASGPSLKCAHPRTWRATRWEAPRITAARAASALVRVNAAPRWLTGSEVGKGPATTDQRAMSAENCLGGNEQRCPPFAWHQLGQRRDERPVRRGEAGTGDLPVAGRPVGDGARGSRRPWRPPPSDGSEAVRQHGGAGSRGS